MEIIYSIEKLPAVALKIWELLTGMQSRVIALHGEMGAGKTTFASALIKAMGSSDSGNSPTFSIINQYRDHSGKAIYHMDWYRLNDEEEIIQAGGEDIIYSGNWCLVEWSEKAPALLPADTIHIYLYALSSSKRKLVLDYPQG